MFSTCIPAKILLFGEYGLLDGGLGLALSTYQHNFEIACELSSLTDPSAPTEIFVKSSFFKNGFCETSFCGNSLGETGLMDKNSDGGGDESFFVKALRPWQHELRGQRLFIDVKKSFLPRYGFGTSSALLSALHLFLTEKFALDCQSAETWQRLQASLLAVQGKGSGYDVAVQTTAARLKAVRQDDKLWAVQWGTQDAPVCQQLDLQIESKEWGVVLDSGIYSDTKKTLASFVLDDKFKTAQSAIAAAVIEGRIAVREAVDKSLQLSRDAGAFEQAPAEFLQLLRYLTDCGLSFKTLGAGNGDAIWVFGTSAAQLQSTGFCHPLTRKPLADSVLFDFASTFGNAR